MLNRSIGHGICLLPPADAGSDRFLGGGLFLPAHCGVALIVLAAFSELILSASSETPGPVVVCPPRVPLPKGQRRAGHASPVEFGRIGFVCEWLAEALPVVTQLGFGNGQVLPNTNAFGAVAGGKTVERVSARHAATGGHAKARSGG